MNDFLEAGIHRLESMNLSFPHLLRISQRSLAIIGTDIEHGSQRIDTKVTVDVVEEIGAPRGSMDLYPEFSMQPFLDQSFHKISVRSTAKARKYAASQELPGKAWLETMAGVAGCRSPQQTFA